MGSTKKRVQYRYDAVGNRSLMIDPDGGRFSYAYDSMKQISHLINPQGDRTTFAYDDDGRRTLKLLANGTRASFTYDDANNITTLANLKSDSSVISKFDYKYDKVGNRTGVVEADGSRVTWSYDNTYQLTAEHRAGTSPYRNTFTYDKNGNRLVKNENNARTTYAYDAANQLKISVDAQGTTTYVYDNDGNQQQVITPTGARTTTSWDYENKTTLVQLPTGTRNTMSYEPDGLRVKLEDSTGTKKFIWDEQNYLAESDENNDTKAVYTNEPTTYGNLISQRRKSAAIWAPSYYHQEALGSTRELTDSVEAITDTYLYDAWGNVISSTGTTLNPFQWTGNVGYYFDSDTGNFYIRARIYGPTVGRWLSVDPLGFVDGINSFTAYFIPSGIDPSGMITVKPICQKLKESPCPFFHQIKWQFSLGIQWFDVKKNRKGTGAPCDGWVVQLVTVDCEIYGCGAPREVFSDPHLKHMRNLKTFSYFEAWKVTKYQKDPVATDTATSSQSKGFGIYKQRGVIKFFCERAGDYPPGDYFPKLKGTKNLGKKWSKKPAGYLTGTACKTSAIDLPTVPANEETPKFWEQFDPWDSQASRSFSVGWDCCENCPSGEPGAIASANPSLPDDKPCP